MSTNLIKLKNMINLKPSILLGKILMVCIAGLILIFKCCTDTALTHQIHTSLV